MNTNRTTIWVASISIVVLFVVVFFAWFFFFRSTVGVSTSGSTSGFGSVPDVTNTTPAGTDTNGTQTIDTTSSAAAQKIFKISDGPIVGATLIQTLRPTTTIARYIRQDDGHVFDVPLGVSGVVPRVVSNITIPGGQRAIWLEGGNAALMQYIDDTGIVKTVYLGFPVSTTTTARALPTRIQFLPDNITDVAASPDGKSIVYLIKTASGSDGYIARDDGTNSKKTFALPLSQLQVSWPSAGTIMAQTKSAAGITGIAFSINTSTGSATQLVTASGLTAAADPTFSHVIYQTSDGTNAPVSYSHTIKTSLNNRLSFSPSPEQCIWSIMNTSVMYCANPTQAIPSNYLDLWHQGVAESSEGIFSYDLSTNNSLAIAIPGSADGGTTVDILEMALSPDERYLSYTTKGGRTLWGVLLAQ